MRSKAPHCLTKSLFCLEEMMNNKQLSENLYGVNAPKRCPLCQAVWPTNTNFCGYDGEKLIDNRSTQNNQPLNSERAKEDLCQEKNTH